MAATLLLENNSSRNGGKLGGDCGLIAGLIGAMARHMVVERRAAPRETVGLGVLAAGHQPHEFAHHVAAAQGPAGRSGNRPRVRRGRFAPRSACREPGSRAVA